MIDKVAELLRQHNLLNDKADLQPVNQGSGGAYVFSTDEKYIAKYAYLPEINPDVRSQLRKEHDFYKLCSGKNFDFIPDIILQFADDDEILIVMKKYSQIKPEEWTETLQKRAMELCARINAVNPDDFCALFQEEPKQESTETEQNHEVQDDSLSASLADWERLQNKFSKYINALILKEMYKNYAEIELYEDTLVLPETFCHGDFHPENLLKDGDRLILCDWQNAEIGSGINAVAFFSSRGADMGLDIDRDKLVKWYHETLFRHTGIKVDIHDFYKKIAVFEFGISFRFWAQYLQNSSVDRVLNIYNAMLRSYNLLLPHINSGY